MFPFSLFHHICTENLSIPNASKVAFKMVLSKLHPWSERTIDGTLNTENNLINSAVITVAILSGSGIAVAHLVK